MSFPDYRPRQLKNELLKLLENSDDLKWEEFDWKENTLHDFVGYTIYRTSDEDQFFFFYETVPNIEMRYKPANNANEYANKIGNKNSEESYNVVRKHFNIWMQSMIARNNVLNDEREIDRRRKANLFSSEQMQKPFQNKKEKTIFLGSINETKFKIRELRSITKQEQDFLISIVEVSEKELEVIIPANEITNTEEKNNQETKQQWFDRLKFRIKSAMNGAKELLIDSLKDWGKDVLKNAISKVLSFLVAGTVFTTVFSSEKQIGINIVVNNSFHIIQDNKLELPIGKSEQLLLNPNYNWKNFEFTDNPDQPVKAKSNFLGWVRKKFSMLIA